DFERYRLPYLLRLQARPNSVAQRALWHALFQTHPFSHTGEMPTDKHPEAAAANHWLTTLLTPEHAVLAIAGDVDPEQALTLARDAFAGWSGGAGFRDPPALSEVGLPATVVTHRPGATQAEVWLGCRLPTTGPREDAANDVLAEAVHSHFRALREALG